MQYERFLDAMIPPVFIPEDISEQKFSILENYRILMDMMVTTVINTLMIKLKIDCLVNLHEQNNDYILNMIKDFNPWLDGLISSNYISVREGGVDILKIDFNDFVRVVYESVVSLYKKYFYLVREVVSRFTLIAHSEMGNQTIPISVDLFGIAINPTLGTYELRAKVSAMV